MTSTTAPRAPSRFLAGLGAPVLEVARDVRDILGVFVATVRVVLRGNLERRLVLEQMYAIGNQSVFFIAVTMGFIGTILVFQSALQALKIVPDLSLLGANYAEILFRDLAASIGAMMLATRVGAGIADGTVLWADLRDEEAEGLSVGMPVMLTWSQAAPRLLAGEGS